MTSAGPLGHFLSGAAGHSLYLLSLEDQFAHADQVLGDFGKTLFAFVSDESRPVDQILVDLFQSFLVVLAELHLRTHTNTHVGTLQLLPSF